MTGGAGAPDGPEGVAGVPDPAALWRDWLTLVQTELAGLATDREALETLQALGQALAGAWARGLGGDGRARDPSGAAAAAAAPAAGGDARMAALLERIDALERRVAELERRRTRGGAG